MKMWSAINTNLTMALNLIYSDINIHFLHDSFVHVTTQNYEIHLSTTPTSAILSITYLTKLKPSMYTGKMVPELKTIVFNDIEESKTQTVKKILLIIKPLLDEK